MRCLLLASFFLANSALGTSVTCPTGTDVTVKPEDISVESHRAGDLQRLSNIFIPAVYKERELFQVEFATGEWKFDSKGKETQAPVVSGELKIRDFNKRKMVQLYTTEETPIVHLFIRYGDLCGYTMVYDHTHNKRL